MDKSPLVLKSGEFMKRPLGRAGLLLLIAAITTAPAVLFFDPAPLWPGRTPRPARTYGDLSLFSDDVAYVGSSRTWDRTVSNLFVPHNTHIVPAGGYSTWALTGWAGKLERAPAGPGDRVLFDPGRRHAPDRPAGRARDGSHRTGHGGHDPGRDDVADADPRHVVFGRPAALGRVWLSWRHSGTRSPYPADGAKPALVLAMISAMVAGWFWTVGHLAGPVAAIYLWVDGRRRCRLAAAAPLAASAIAVGAEPGHGLHVASTATISFHGRTVREAANPAPGPLAHVAGHPREPRVWQPRPGCPHHGGPKARS